MAGQTHYAWTHKFCRAHRSIKSGCIQEEDDYGSQTASCIQEVGIRIINMVGARGNYSLIGAFSAGGAPSDARLFFLGLIFRVSNGERDNNQIGHVIRAGLTFRERWYIPQPPLIFEVL